MAERGNDGPLAPRRNLGGPILPPPPAELVEDARKAEEARKEAARAAAQRTDSEKKIARQVLAAQKAYSEEEEARAKAPQGTGTHPGRETKPGKSKPVGSKAAAGKGAPRRTRRAQLRLVQVDAWSVMKTAFLLSIALGIVLVVAVAIIWSVLGSAGVWDSINSIVRQAVGNSSGKQFDIQEYAGTSRVLGLTMIVAVLDVILVTAIATLGAFLYNLSAALLGGIEVTFAEDS